MSTTIVAARASAQHAIANAVDRLASTNGPLTAEQRSGRLLATAEAVQILVGEKERLDTWSRALEVVLRECAAESQAWLEHLIAEREQ